MLDWQRETPERFPLQNCAKLHQYFWNVDKTNARQLVDVLAGLLLLPQLHLLLLLLIKGNVGELMGAVLERRAPYRWKRPCLRDFWQVTVCDFTKELWIQNFRMTALTFDMLRRSWGAGCIVPSGISSKTYHVTCTCGGLRGWGVFPSCFVKNAFSLHNFNLHSFQINKNAPSDTSDPAGAAGRGNMRTRQENYRKPMSELNRADEQKTHTQKKWTIKLRWLSEAAFCQ